MFQDILVDAMKNKTPVSVYTDVHEPSKFSFGFIQAFSDEFVLLASITPFGFYDGYTLLHFEDIYRAEEGDRYANKVYKLYQIHEQQHSMFPTTENIIRDILQFSLEKHLVAAIELMNSGCDDVLGFVSELQGEKVVIEQVDDDGRLDGNSAVSLGDITCVTVDSEREMALKLLSEN